MKLETPIKYVGWVNEPGDLAERLICGAEMLQSQRQTFPIDPVFTGNRGNQITGTVGFLDFRTVATHETVASEEHRIIRFFGFNLKLGPSKRVMVPRTYLALELGVIGVEREYRRKGCARQLLEGLEQVAKNRKIDLLVSAGPSSDNEASINFHTSGGFIRANRFFREGSNNKYDCYPYYKLVN